MRQGLQAVLVALTLCAGGAARAGDTAGDFDYYVMSLGWSSSWCQGTGDGRGDPQCDIGRGLTFTLHGLWPQYESGYPADCFSTFSDPPKSATAGMADIMGGSGLAWHEWKKHGRCAGLAWQDYFDQMRQAYGAVTIPPVFSQVRRDLTLPAQVIEDAFVEANPAMERDGITVTCDEGRIAEVRICLTRDLSPRPCGADVVRDCRLKDAELPAVR
jgi:ribonuclease T2